MEYVITTDRPFDELEAQTIEALELQGMMVQCTFSLRSAVVADRGDTNGVTSPEHGAATGDKPGYSVLLLYAGGALRRPLGLITLYQRGDRMVISAALAPEDNQPLLPADTGDGAAGAGADAAAELVGTLVRGGLALCVEVADRDPCIDHGMAAE